MTTDSHSIKEDVVVQLTYVLPEHGRLLVCGITRDHSFPRQIFPNSAGQFAKFRGSLQQIFHE